MSSQEFPRVLPTCRILGVRVHNVTWEQTLAHVEIFIASRQPHHVVTVNPEFIMAAQRDPEFLSILNRADLALPDGIGLLWAGRWLGQPFQERVTGSDFVPRFAALAARRSYRPFFLGAAPGIAEQAAEKLAQQHPGFRVANCYAGSPDPAEEDAIVLRVRESQPDALFVAYGAPAQDYWIARNLARLEVPVAMGVGGTFDFIAGVVPRAPRWMQRLGLEWLFRLMRQPWRWRRQVALVRFVGLVLAARFKQDGQR
jgi:N-acetylglucosaminyldiphosphoundecaprenol N-acetyl-beta-D-mannosaminyltransferase